MVVKLDTVIAREKLKPRREPYWHRFDAGCMLGFRKMTASSIGSWTARYRNPETGERPKLALGDFSELPAGERFGAAKKAAESWFAHLGRGGSAKSVTVKMACAQYVAHVRADKGDAKADDIAARFARWVDDDSKLAQVELSKLTRAHIEGWRRKLAKAPVVVNPHAEEPTTRMRAASSVNRDMTALRAALNYAHDVGAVTNDMAWRVALRPIENADGQRDAYLDRKQRGALIEAAQVDVATFLRGLSLVPLRPGALAALTVANFDKRLGVITIGKDKAGRDRKIKLPLKTAEFFAEQAKVKEPTGIDEAGAEEVKDRSPTAPLLARADGKAWDKDAWKKPVKAAAKSAELPESTTAYAMRHSVITDLVTGGLDLLTVAQLSGTSVAMIERHYGHLRADHAAEALATLAL